MSNSSYVINHNVWGDIRYQIWVFFWRRFCYGGSKIERFGKRKRYLFSEEEKVKAMVGAYMHGTWAGLAARAIVLCMLLLSGNFNACFWFGRIQFLTGNQIRILWGLASLSWIHNIIISWNQMLIGHFWWRWLKLDFTSFDWNLFKIGEWDHILKLKIFDRTR